MKVLALIYGDEASWEAASEEERNTVMTQYRAFGESADGKILEGAELASTRAATTVRVRDGETIVTDGPYAETKEQLGGFYVFEAELAAGIPGAAHGAVEVRAAREEDSE